MADKHVIILNSPSSRALARQGVDRAPVGYALELRPATRSDKQNDALHGLITQIMKQRTHHNGLRMDKALWKATFLQALGEEVRFVPTLAGDGVFPLGLKTSALSKPRFAELIDLILAWAAQEGLVVKHFQEAA